ncbi:NurA domain-containing protein [Alkalithermobacter thermoalcaliphilus JW-YL-7 = DSM 7308]|uniref:NurA domain-containing protein n=1 Tax=Alkalithermobacter thermoalcaliphilus JW-YL-7 = DSM 7308 TaxID=1121328 RepID=A0A150FSM5_CLOPD|nr:NurA domain-containing protein [[Clostridium] paradoxum JW-YL-7 = DSM 7308]SHL19895.1 NurA domain-containing protein [[Clostridium] paradoxum JW-YL-7 = DSM 7308]
MEINELLIQEFKKTNENLKQKLRSIKKVEKQKLRDLLDIKKARKLNKDEMKNILNNKDIVGVDGSKNKIGNLYPHYIIAIQALAKPVDSTKEPIYLNQIYCPLIEGDEDDENKEKSMMAKLEAQVSIEAIKKYTPYLVMVDGSLMTYRIRCGKEWDELRQLAVENNCLLVGVIEEIKTKEISFHLSKHIDIDDQIYDKDLLFGVLDEGEYVIIEPDKSKKNKEGIVSCFFRTSKDPSVIGIDILKSQIDYIDTICSIIYTLTNPSGRGIPIWIDIVDKEVKISNEMINVLAQTYIDKELLEIFINPKREKRS